MRDGTPIGRAAARRAAPRDLRSRDTIEWSRALLEPFAVALANDPVTTSSRGCARPSRPTIARCCRGSSARTSSDTIVGADAGLRAVMERVEQVAPTDAPVLILGETGSGKEVVARAIHARSRRAAGPVVRVNCGAIPPELIDSELFGHERGSFTGAIARRKGWFERADGGTLFLDEIGELPLDAQVRLLRVLQDGTLRARRRSQAADRSTCASSPPRTATCARWSREGTFREDLWYRISVFPIRPAAAARARSRTSRARGALRAPRRASASAAAADADRREDIELLRRYPWPGNVRELAAVIERAAILGNGRGARRPRGTRSGGTQARGGCPPKDWDDAGRQCRVVRAKR